MNSVSSRLNMLNLMCLLVIPVETSSQTIGSVGLELGVEICEDMDLSVISMCKGKTEFPVMQINFNLEQQKVSLSCGLFELLFYVKSLPQSAPNS